MLRHLPLALVLLACAVPAHAQVAGNGVRERLAHELNERTRLLREGRYIRTNVKVVVRLLNGSRLGGVVRNGRFIERVDGLSFIAADLTAPGAGMRVWYYNDTNSYIFLPYTTIRSHKIGDRLTNSEVAAIARRFEEQDRAAREAARRRIEAQAARERAERARKLGEDVGDSGDAEPEPIDATLTLSPEQQALIAEYPPSEGWSRERMEEIEARRITVGVFPDAKGRRFVEIFPEWNHAYEVWLATQQQAIEDEEPAPTSRR